MKVLATGSTKAFQTLFDRHGAAVLGYSGRILGNKFQAEDISQEVWIKVVRLAPSFQSGNFKSWLLTVTRNASFQVLRGQKRTEALNDETLEKTADVSIHDFETLLVHQANLEKVKAAVDQLPEKQRMALSLWLTEEMSYEAIAQVLETSESAVKSLLFRARDTLRLMLEETAS